ncbi:MAG: CvpA family protein [Aquabacterium sp.]|jgi:membrane protein required for colicin V production|nr:MAG: CvpA family protein [Aquabacterium sp.]
MLETGLGWIDMAWLAVLSISVVVGLLRGLVSEVFSLLGWGVAYFGSHWLAPQVAPVVPVGEPGSRLNMLAAMALLFICLLVAWGLLSWMVKQLVRASPLSAADRALGGLFGLARAVMIGFVAVTLVSATPLAKSPAWQASHGVGLLQAMLAGIRPLLPDEVLEFLPSQADGMRIGSRGEACVASSV